MRFLVDECTGPAVATWLRDNGYETFSVYEQARGASDDWIIRKSADEDWILITNDKDFGEKAFRDNVAAESIVLLRLEDERATNKIHVLARLLEGFSQQLHGRFTVVTEKHVRFARTRPAAIKKNIKFD
jgi:predicted nuclease of predicted toxin-antitoxin system